MEDFYQDEILDHYRSPHNAGRLDPADATAEDLNPLCGDRIRMDLAILDGRVTAVRFDGKGCAISQASASMLTDQLVGKTLEEVATLSPGLAVQNLGIGISPARMKCATLGITVARKAAVGAIVSAERPPAV